MLIYLAMIVGVMAGYAAARLWQLRSGRNLATASSRLPIVLGFFGGALGVIAVMILVGPSRLSWSPQVVQITSQQAFDTFIAETGDDPALIDVYAVWCGPCRRMAPDINQLAQEGVRVAVIDADDPANEELYARLGTSYLPFLLIVRNGTIVSTQIGYHTPEELRELVSAAHNGQVSSVGSGIVAEST